ncbi:MAG: hypothetical protein IKZ07_06530, partial [Akkermansia sp.]|nr:hypothetical protein [Akkermansia sp.]
MTDSTKFVTKIKQKNPPHVPEGSVSNLLVVEMTNFVFPLESQEVYLAQFQEQVPHIKQPARFGLYPF